jgi:hypothetical protein
VAPGARDGSRKWNPKGNACEPFKKIISIYKVFKLLQIPNNKKITMTKIPNNKPVYDLEERTFQFAKAVRLFVKTLPNTTANIEDSKQLVFKIKHLPALAL